MELFRAAMPCMGGPSPWCIAIKLRRLTALKKFGGWTGASPSASSGTFGAKAEAPDELMARAGGLFGALACADDDDDGGGAVEIFRVVVASFLSWE